MDAADGLAYYLAEWYLPEITETSVDEMVAKLDAAAAIVSSEGTQVRLVVTLAVPTDEVLYGVFGAHSPPYISNRWLEQPDDLPSLKENDEYFISCQQAVLLGSVYDPGNENSKRRHLLGRARDRRRPGRPAAPRDLGQRTRSAARRGPGLLPAPGARGCRVGRVVAGTCHGGDLLFAGVMPDVYAASLRDVSGFAKSIS